MDEPVTLSQSVNVICLPTQKTQLIQQTCFATGWGSLVVKGELSHYPKNLTVPLLNTKECEGKIQKTILGNEFKLDKSSICAGTNKDVDLCTGDGGAPLACPIQNDKFVLMGLSSWGIGCESKVPGVYTSIQAVLPWINETLEKKKLNATVYTV